MSAFGIIIPARFASTRLPGKPLRTLAGRPMISWVVESAKRTGAAFVVVATDDERIASVVRAEGGEALMTSPDHTTGTDRLAEVMRVRGLAADTIVVNVQGDEPLLPPEYVMAAAQALAARPLAALSTLAAAITEPAELFSPHAVKVVLDQYGFARTFSRAPIPWARDAFGPLTAGPPAVLPAGVPFLRHVGLYAYRAGTLAELAAAPAVPWEQAESLEQLRALWLGLPIHVTVVPEAPPAGVDTEEDLERVERVLNTR